MLQNNGKLFPLSWVPTHVGVLGNEKTEAAVGAWLARAAVSNSQVLQTPTARGELEAKISRHLQQVEREMKVQKQTERNHRKGNTFSQLYLF